MTATARGRPRPASVVDASVWVSRFLTTDVNHATSAAWLNGQLSAGTVLALYLLALVRRDTSYGALLAVPHNPPAQARLNVLAPASP